MSKITQNAANHIIQKVQYIALFTEGADKEIALLVTFVSGIAVSRDGS